MSHSMCKSWNDSGHGVLMLSRCPSKDQLPVGDDAGAVDGQ